MEQDKNNLSNYIATMRRIKGRWITVSLVIFLTGLSIAFGLPAVYSSSATILIEQQEIPQELVRSTVTSFADQRIQVISQRVMTRYNLLKIIRKYDLYKDEQEKEPLEVVLANMRENIEMQMISAEVVDPRSGRPTVATIAFILKFYNKSAKLAQKVTNELVSLYLNENLRSRRQQATEAADFLEEGADKLNQIISDLEKKLAKFKQKNANQLPDLSQLNLKLLDRTDTGILEMERQVRAIEERKIYLESELAQMNPYATLYSENGERLLSSADRLKSLKTKYISLSAIYAPDHPDLVKMKKQINALEIETGDNVDDTNNRRQLTEQKAELETQLVLLRETYAENHPGVQRLQRTLVKLGEALNDTPVIDSLLDQPVKKIRADNPVYARLQTELAAAEAEHRAWLEKGDRLQALKRDYETRLARTPQVEMEYRGLMRDYENARIKYREMNAKKMEAQLGEVLETERKGERFTLIEPPQMPEEPVRPNRLAIVFLGLVFSLIGAGGTIVVSQSLDKTIRGIAGIESLLGTSPLAVIPVIQGEVEQRYKYQNIWIAGIGVLVFSVIAIATFHWLIMPLDVLWYGGLRRLGF